MSNIRIYIKPEEIDESVLICDKDLVNKMRNVLRFKSGQSFTVFDGKGREYCFKISQINRRSIEIIKQSLQRSKEEPNIKVTLAFPFSREDRVDFMLQKSTELGVDSLIPFKSERSDKLNFNLKKLKRWQKIIQEAARQSERLWIPELQEPVGFEELLKKEYNLKVAGKIDGPKVEEVLNKNAKSILISVGPVGDFSPEEYEKLKESNFKFINLSKNLLRVETAAVFSVGIVKYFLNES